MIVIAISVRNLTVRYNRNMTEAATFLQSSQEGKKLVDADHFIYRLHSASAETTYWKFECADCHARARTPGDLITNRSIDHNHFNDSARGEVLRQVKHARQMATNHHNSTRIIK